MLDIVSQLTIINLTTTQPAISPKIHNTVIKPTATERRIYNTYTQTYTNIKGKLAEHISPTTPVASLSLSNMRTKPNNPKPHGFHLAHHETAWSEVELNLSQRTFSPHTASVQQTLS